MVATSTLIGRAAATGRLARGGAGGSINVGELERWFSVLGGSLLATYGLGRGGASGLGLAALGGGMLYRGLSGHCHLYGALGVNTAEPHGDAASVAAGRGVRVNRAITVNRPVEELFRLWRNFEGLPRFMSHLVSVKVNGNRSHWVARGPAGSQVEWDAEIVNEEPNRLIAWRSLEGSQVSTAGSVHFQPAPGGQGTEVRVELKYDPPAGRLGSWTAWLFGAEPSQQIAEDLQRFKQLAEAGGTSAAQPTFRR